MGEDDRNPEVSSTVLDLAKFRNADKCVALLLENGALDGEQLDELISDMNSEIEELEETQREKEEEIEELREKINRLQEGYCDVDEEI